MKLIKNKYAILIILVSVLFVLLVKLTYYSKSIDIKKDIEKADFTIIKSIEARNIWPVYLATYNTCNPNVTSGQCIIECGFGTLNPCYFFKYDLATQRPHIIATYYSQDDAMYQTLMKFKDRNTLQFMTRKDFVSTSSDSHYVWFTKEVDLQTGNITIVKVEETYEPYESYP